jgi:hypothetical protein
LVEAFVLFVSLLVLAGSLFVAAVVSLLFVVKLVELLLSADPPGFNPYPSAYQPPPLRRNPVPPETCRLAEALPHLGQSRSGASLILCSASHWLPQAVQMYS